MGKGACPENFALRHDCHETDTAFARTDPILSDMTVGLKLVAISLCPSELHFGSYDHVQMTCSCSIYAASLFPSLTSFYSRVSHLRARMVSHNCGIPKLSSSHGAHACDFFGTWGLCP